MVISAVLDPQFKSVKFLDEAKMEDVKTELIDRIKNLPDPFVENPPPQKKSKSALDILLGEEEGTSVSDLSEHDEVQRYFAEKAISRRSDVLTWWKENSVNYPRLAVIAKSVLAAPSTSASSERIFSVAGLTVNRLRSAL